MTARTDAQEKHERVPADVLELDLDYCQNTYGVAPCTAGRVESGTAQAGAASTLTLRALASAVNDAYKNMTARLVSGAGSVQERAVTAYVGATKVATVAPRWRTNLVLRSEELDNAYWNKNSGGSTVTANFGTAPDGAVSSERVTDGNINSPWILAGGGALTVAGMAASTQFTFSVYLKRAAGTAIVITIWDNVSSFQELNVTAQLPLGQWVRVSITRTTGAGSTAWSAGIGQQSSDERDFEMWGSKIEAASDMGDYIKTVAAAVTLPDVTSVYDVINRPAGCYNVFAGESPCQDPPNYVKGTKTLKFCERGMPLPSGELVRPYITKVSPTPTEISTAKGLAMRSQMSVELADEPARDDLDKYIEDRTTPAGGTYWPRLLARNPNAAGRPARLRRGYAMTPWDWTTFQTELYIVEALRGPSKQGTVTAVLSDLLKLLDRTMVPAPTDGKLVADLPAVSDTGTARGATLNTIDLREKASAVDDFYNGQEVFILENTGAGQRRVISDYVGVTRTATLSVNWQVVPDTTSTYEVTPLQFALPAGKGAQYPSPGAEPEYVRLGDEVIRYTAKAADTLSWAAGSYRAQFGTARADHKAKDIVQLCRAWIDKPFKTVAQNILNEGGVIDTYIDLTQLAKEDADWLGLARLTTCIADPEKSSELYADVLKDVMMMSWWHPVQQKVRFKVDMPELGAASFTLTDHQLMLRETEAQRLDEERITRAAVDFGLVSATEDRKKRQNFRTIELFIDGVAEGPNSFNDKRQDLRQSRWFAAANEILAKANVARKLRRLGEAPWRVKHQLDPRDEVTLGSLADLTTRKIVDAAGNAKLKRCRVTRIADRGSHFEVELRSTGFEKRYAFIAPNGQPNYGAASEAQRVYAYISNGSTMSDGTSAYLIS